MDTVIAPIILFLIFTATTYYVLAPLLAQPSIVPDVGPAVTAAALELRKISLYKQIREVEFEHQIGMTDREDFERTRTDLVVEAAEVLRALESSPAAAEPAATGPPPVLTASCPNCGTPAAPEARFCTDCGSTLGKTCTRCGAQTGPGDRFCSACGRGLVS